MASEADNQVMLSVFRALSPAGDQGQDQEGQKNEGEGKTPPIFLLDDFMLLVILKFLPPRSLLLLAQTCTRLCAVASEDTYALRLHPTSFS